LASSANVRRIPTHLAHDYGRAVVVVTHDRDFAAADHVIVMSGGRIRGQ
jgi:lipoprotein-releasing system ATP-binding protein